MRKNLLVILIFYVLITSLAMASVVTSPTDPVMAVDPSNNWELPGATFTVNITIANITEEKSLYGWEFSLNFNSSIINVTSFQEGPFLKAAGPTWWTPYIDNDAGNVGGSDFLFTYPATGAYGSGVLANITFYAKAAGETPLDLTYHILRHWNGTDTEAISHTAVNGTLKVKILGDTNGDGIVDIFDISSISAHWSPGPPVGPLGYDIQADLNKDGAVDIFDIGICSAHWGETV